jgi:hypothetical protein
MHLGRVAVPPNIRDLGLHELVERLLVGGGKRRPSDIRVANQPTMNPPIEK